MNNSFQHPITHIVLPLIEGICKYKEDLQVKERVADNDVSIVLFPHMADYPKLCGKEGRQIKALRFLVKHMGKKIGVNAEIDIKESWHGEREGKSDFEFNPEFDKHEAIKLLDTFRLAIWPDNFGTRDVISNTEGDKLHVYLVSISDEDTSLIIALADVFYPYGYRNGRKIVIHIGPNNSEHRTIRQSPVPSGKRER